jgi:hypothetical protein
MWATVWAKMWGEIRTLLWLQYRLTRAVFRGRRLGDRLRMLGLISRLLSLLFSLPMFVLMGGALAAGLILLTPRAAYELAMSVNVGLLFIWLLLPASYTSQTIERFEMSRLFAYPIRFRSIVVGSTLISLLTMTGLWTAPLLMGEIVGLAWHRPLALPLIALGALPTFLILALTGRIMEDLFDLVAGDRRLRALALTLLMLPFMFCWVGQYAAQFATDQFRRLPQFERLPFRETLESLDRSESLAEFLEILSPSRLLIWLPPGWSTAGMASALMGPMSASAWARSLLYVALSAAFVAALLWVHARIVRRLQRGAALRVGAERVRDRTLHSRTLRGRAARLRLPGPPSFWALVHKDWLHLRRSPLPRRLIFSAVISALGMLFAITREPPRRLADIIPLAVIVFSITLISLVVNLGLTANYLGAVDREGYATLALSAVDRRQMLLSANLAALLFVLVLYVPLTAIVGLVSRVWIVIPLGLYLGLCVQIGGSPAYNLASILGPYRAQLHISGERSRGNFWGILAWFVAALPVLALTVIPYIFWRPGLALTMPMGVLYSVALYLATLKPLARLLQRREYEILEAVAAQE